MDYRRSSSSVSKIFPSCFANMQTQVPERPSLVGKGTLQNMVTCVYQTKFAGVYHHVAVTWLRNANSVGLCITIVDPICQYTFKADMKPWYFWRKQGSKRFEVSGSLIKVCWDLSSAKYLHGPEPQEGFFVAVFCDGEVVLLLGDKFKDAYRKTLAKASTIDANLLSRMEHVFGKSLFCTKTRFGESGKAHDVIIECQTHALNKEPYMLIKIDKKPVVHVKSLTWKFRGNQTVFIDNSPVEIFWDVSNWVFNTGVGNAIFMFQNGILCSKELVEVLSEVNGRVSGMKLKNRTCSLRPDEGLEHVAGFSLLLNLWRWCN